MIGRRFSRCEREIQAWHEREMERHVTFVAVPEVRHGILRPLVRLSEQHAVLVVFVHERPEAFQFVVGLWKVLAVRPFALEEIGDGVEAQSVDAEIEPEPQHVGDGLSNERVVEVEVRLMGEEPVPVVRLGDRIPRPVRRLGVLEDDPDVVEAVRRVTPDVEVAFGATGFRTACPLEPGVLVRGVVDDEFGDNSHVASVRRIQELLEVIEGSVAGVNVVVLGDVVPVVAQRRRIERQEPDGVDAEATQVVESGRETLEVADAVVVGVGEGADMNFVDDGVFVPEWWAQNPWINCHTVPQPRAVE